MKQSILIWAGLIFISFGSFAYSQNVFDKIAKNEVTVLELKAPDVNPGTTHQFKPNMAYSGPGLQLGGFAISGKIGTLGYGFELTKAIIPFLNARIGLNHFAFKYQGREGAEQIEFDIDLKLNTFTMLLDWHPFKEKFRLSFGVIHNGNEASGTGRPTKNYKVGGKIYTPEKLGDIDGIVDFQKFAPFLGIGLGNAVQQNKRFGFIVDFGLLFQNSPKVTMEAEGLIEPTTEQEGDVEDDIKGFNLYPVLSIGFSYRLF